MIKKYLLTTWFCVVIPFMCGRAAMLKASSVVEVNDRHFVVADMSLSPALMRKIMHPSAKKGRKKNAVQEPSTELNPLLLSKSVLFAPDDDISHALQELIDAEHHGIKMAMYMLTDHDISRALVKAYERGVAVEIVVDQSCIDGEYKAIEGLRQAHIPLFVYKAQKKGRMGPELMHNKFTIFSANKGHVPFVVTGSCNATQASKNHCENVVLVREPEAIVRYQERFEHLKTQCALLDKRQTLIAKNQHFCFDGMCG